MDIVAGIKLVVKNTFLEVDERREGGGGARLRRCKSDPAVLAACACSDGGGASPDSDAESVASGCGLSSAASVASATTASTASSALPATTGSRATATAVRGARGALPRAAREGEGKNRTAKAGAGHNRMGAAASKADQRLTTVMLCNVPNDYTRSMLLDLLDRHGFARRYDFAYLPVDFTRSAGLGYAFVNMTSAADAQAVRRSLEGFRKWSVPSSKICSVRWSDPCQGLEANLDRYKNSPVMHASVPDEFKPLLFREGVRVPFPEPTIKIKKPFPRKTAQ